jgi:acyl carrier protein
MEDKIKEIMAIVLEIQINDIDENSSQDNLESWDSLKHMQLIVALEEEFDVDFDDINLIEMQSFKLIKNTLLNIND